MNDERRPLAVVAITKHGVGQVAGVKHHFPDADFYISKKFETPGLAANYYEKPLRDVVEEIFPKYSTLIFFVSLGAVVRLIAPILKDKKTDPAVLVVDDAGKYVISVLSGHLGGANEMTEWAAAKLGAQAVITTASDVGKTIPVDILGRNLGWRIEDFSNVTRVSAAVVNEEPVALVLEYPEPGWWTRPTPLPANIKVLGGLSEFDPAAFNAVLLVTDRIVPSEELAPIRDKVVIYRPKSLFLGMGCDTGTPADHLQELVAGALNQFGLHPGSVAALATVEQKKDEPALVELAGRLGVALTAFTKDECNSVADRVVSPSAAKKFLNVVGVSEPAALLAAQDGGHQVDLVIPKQKAAHGTLAAARRVFAQ